MALTPEERLLQQREKPLFYSDTTSDAIATEQANLENKRANILAAMERAKEAESTQLEPQFDFNQPTSGESAQISESGLKQGAILPGGVRITQAFGNYNPGVEKFSKGVNLGTDFAVKKGTPLGLPPGNWEVVTAFSGAKEGNRGANSGSGNLVKVRNIQTGEMLAFEHLDQVNVLPGKVYNGGTVIGKSGNTGNSTGPHASIPYQDASGKYVDVLKSPYAKYIFGAMKNV